VLALLCGALAADGGQTWLAARRASWARGSAAFISRRGAPDGLTLRRVVIETPDGA
jgi:hypothetical protein